MKSLNTVRNQLQLVHGTGIQGQANNQVIGLGRCYCRTMEALLLFFFYCCCLRLSVAVDTITASQFIRDPEAIVSNGGNFKLGFFSPLNSTNQYVGIWYNVSVTAPTWVANRNKPLNDSSGVVRISDDGNLVVLNGQQEILWSTNVSGLTGNSTARLTDDGNLVLQDAISGNTMWESFQHPTNVFVEKMKLSANEKTGKMTLLTSWLSASDPSVGSFSSGVNPLTVPEVFIWNESRPYWRSGPWDGRLFNGVLNMNPVYLHGFNLVEDGDGNTALSYTNANEPFLSNYVLTPEGKLIHTYWDDGKKNWELKRVIPNTECDVYGKCGTYGSCNSQNSPICSCLKGFEPKFADDWNRNNWTSGCVRRRPLECIFLSDIGQVHSGDRFLKLEMVKLPNFGQWSSSGEFKCRFDCWSNCTCMAYSYHSSIGCMSWTQDLIDIQQFASGGADLYIRISSSELDGNKNKKVIIIRVTVSLGAATIAICVFFSWRWMAKYKEKRRKSGEVSFLEDKMDQVKLQELPLFSLQKLVTATETFHASNKLGQGGFGPVYRGKLQDGQEIAVKRLSTASGQGIQEFMNEVVVISKLQHRNLVRLLGCCVEGEEKMLVYEYMPNKSLDAFLFGPRKQELLDWRRRFKVVEGICRGLLHLHRDSRLRIIHRDLKASNILLDHELNPKISDFGMARIFGSNQDQADTRRVVGTYGYMAPEYAMEGRFSEKSDVFSFGVLLLEIVSGRRNTSFYGDEQALSLLGYAWKLWSEDNVAALVDPAILDPSYRLEILRCIHVGLLCVQEFAKDRPSMSTVVSMLNSEIADLPTPKQPAFTERPIAVDTDSPFQGIDQKCSVNDVTVTILKGR